MVICSFSSSSRLEKCKNYGFTRLFLLHPDIQTCSCCTFDLFCFPFLINTYNFGKLKQNCASRFFLCFLPFLKVRFEPARFQQIAGSRIYLASFTQTYLPQTSSTLLTCTKSSNLTPSPGLPPSPPPASCFLSHLRSFSCCQPVFLSFGQLQCGPYCDDQEEFRMLRYTVWGQSMQLVGITVLASF